MMGRLFVWAWLMVCVCTSCIVGAGRRAQKAVPPAGRGLAVMCRGDRKCFIGGEVKSLRSEV